MTRELLEDGHDLVVAVGGDGTINEVTNGFLENDQPVRPEACLGILPIGTGGDFRRTLGISGKPDEAIEVLATGVPFKMDVGKAAFQMRDGSRERRYFVNVASFGLGGEVAERMQNVARLLGGSVAFLWATLCVFFGYGGRSVWLEADDPSLNSEYFITNIAVGNGQFHGGGMRPCPDAILNDGLLEVTIIDYLSMLELARDIRSLYTENIYEHPKVHHYRTRKVTATADQPTFLELDGEPVGTLPFEAVVLPQRISVMVPATSSLLEKK
jgi:YegS/Rv2252/BmrU family lipid kinase